MRKSSLIVLIILACTMALTACSSSGGGGGNATTPVANAGPDQTVATGSVVTLDGSGSSDPNGDPLTYRWTFTSVPAGSGVTISALSDAAAVNPTFTPDVDGVYVLDLVVNDGSADSAPDAVTITSSSTAPIANAGPDQTVVTGSVVTLDGSASSDPNGDPLTYSWTFTSVPAGSALDDTALSDATAVNPTFTPDVPGTYVLDLVVNNGAADSAPDAVTVTSTAIAPAAYWNFEEGAGTTAADSAGTNDGTLIGPPEWVAGRVGDFALSFNGTDDYVSVPHADLFNAEVFTLSFWLNSVDDGTTRGIIRRVQGWHIRRNAAHVLEFCLENAAGTTTDCFSSGYTIPNQEWHQYDIVVDNAATEVSFYVDGVSNGTYLYTTPFLSSTGNLYIGQFSPIYRFNGQIDDVRFYDSAVDPVGP